MGPDVSLYQRVGADQVSAPLLVYASRCWYMHGRWANTRLTPTIGNDVLAVGADLVSAPPPLKVPIPFEAPRPTVKSDLIKPASPRPHNLNPKPCTLTLDP